MNKADLKTTIEAIAVLQKEGRSDRPILWNMLVTEDTIEYTNLEVALRVRVPGGHPYLTEPAYIPITQCKNYVTKTSADNLDFVKDGAHTMSLRSGKSRLKVPTIALTPKTHIEIPHVADMELNDQDNMRVLGVELQRGIDRCLPFMDRSDSHKALDCLELQYSNTEDKLHLISSDQVSLRSHNMTVGTYGGSFNIHNPNLTMATIKLLKVLHRHDKSIWWNITTAYEGKTLVMYNDTYTIIQRTHDVKFPHWKQAVEEFTKGTPKSTTYKMDLKVALGELSSVLTTEHRWVVMREGMFKACTPLGEIEVDFDTGPLDNGTDSIGFNFGYMEAYMKTLGPDERVYLHHSGARKPVVCQDESGFFFMSPVAV